MSGRFRRARRGGRRTWAERTHRKAGSSTDCSACARPRGRPPKRNCWPTTRRRSSPGRRCRTCWPASSPSRPRGSGSRPTRPPASAPRTPLGSTSRPRKRSRGCAATTPPSPTCWGPRSGMSALRRHVPSARDPARRRTGCRHATPTSPVATPRCASCGTASPRATTARCRPCTGWAASARRNSRWSTPTSTGRNTDTWCSWTPRIPIWWRRSSRRWPGSWDWRR